MAKLGGACIIWSNNSLWILTSDLLTMYPDQRALRASITNNPTPIKI
jgi:hypothetical protein